MSNEMDTRMDKIAQSLGGTYTADQVKVIKHTVAKGTTDAELALFLYTAKEAGLSALQKEVWCYKDKQGNLLTFAGRDGFLARAQKNPAYNGLRSVEVCENDEITLNIPMGIVNHIINPKKPRGKIIGAYCFVFRKDGEPTIEWVEFDVYNKGWNAWKSHPAEMIKKVAESHALKKACGISGIQSEFDFDVDELGVAKPIQTVLDVTHKDVTEIEAKINSFDNVEDLLEWVFEQTEYHGDMEFDKLVQNKKDLLIKKEQ